MCKIVPIKSDKVDRMRTFKVLGEEWYGTHYLIQDLELVTKGYVDLAKPHTENYELINQILIDLYESRRILPFSCFFVRCAAPLVVGGTYEGYLTDKHQTNKWDYLDFHVEREVFVPYYIIQDPLGLYLLEGNLTSTTDDSTWIDDPAKCTRYGSLPDVVKTLAALFVSFQKNDYRTGKLEIRYIDDKKIDKYPFVHVLTLNFSEVYK